MTQRNSRPQAARKSSLLKSLIELHKNRTNSASPSQPCKSPFFRLPGEVRNKIYAEVFSSPISYVSELLGLTKTCPHIAIETQVFAAQVCAQLPQQIFRLEPWLLPRQQASYLPKSKSSKHPQRPYVYDPWNEQERLTHQLIWTNFSPCDQRLLSTISDLHYIPNIQIALPQQWGSTILTNKAPLEEFFFALTNALNTHPRPTATTKILEIITPKYFQQDKIKATVIAMRPLHILKRKVGFVSHSEAWTRILREYWVDCERWACSAVYVREEFERFEDGEERGVRRVYEVRKWWGVGVEQVDFGDSGGCRSVQGGDRDYEVDVRSNCAIQTTLKIE